MNPESSQKPASIKDFCNMLFCVVALPLCLAWNFFCAHRTRATTGEADSRVKFFFHRPGPEVLATAVSSLDSAESAPR